ncbi:helix-turn-helix domain-containing protein [Rhizobium sp. SL42]|uniref:helix-turn-helix domain-containing protein n=1 Tax=Rhizobium sp. SL42 TaxID=2806346 RepID=UPI001F2E4F30|nr:XRE family transcriptional regulator [Rhizobium sp. SL42]UJW76735.1 helix-turn-helix transcriptional regulator [Rhizobium sp. SL42]
MEIGGEQFEKTVAERLKSLRAERGLTLDALADLSGVSRAMISRVERAEASPTAALLARLCSALGVSLSVFFDNDCRQPRPLARRADQPLWRDPDSGYLRRAVSPPATGRGAGSAVDIIEVEFPAGAEVRFPGRLSSRSQTQHVWVFEGEIVMHVGEDVYHLSAGDCLFMNVADVHGYRNPGPIAARYAVVVNLGG